MWEFLIPLIILALGRIFLGERVTAIGWVLFGLYWITRLPFYIFEARSFVEPLLILIALPVSIYAAKLTIEENTTIFKITDITLVAGTITLIANTPIIEQLLVEIVASHTVYVMSLFGYETTLQTGPNQYLSSMSLESSPYTTYITLACTGIGAFSVFAGVFTAINTSLKKRAFGIILTGFIIYTLNIARNVFVAISYGKQWFDYPWIAQKLGYSSEAMTSFFISHNAISQPLAVLTLLGLLYISMKITDEVTQLMEEILSLLEKPLS